jgi:hypothetical protein
MRRLYFWEEWFRQGHFTVFRGTHYWISQAVMYQMIRNAASRYGVRVRLTDRGDSIEIEVVGETVKSRGVVPVGGD